MRKKLKEQATTNCLGQLTATDEIHGRHAVWALANVHTVVYRLLQHIATYHPMSLASVSPDDDDVLLDFQPPTLLHVYVTHAVCYSFPPFLP